MQDMDRSVKENTLQTNRTVPQEKDLSVKETNRYVYKSKRTVQETKHIRPNLPLSLDEL